MARGKPFAVLPTKDPELEKVQRAVLDFANQVEDQRRGTVISTVEVVPRSLLLSEQLVVVYTGKGSDAIRLPLANLRGAGRGQLLLIANQGTGTVTLTTSGRDTLNGTATIPVNGTAVLWGDGATKWHQVSALSLPSVGPGAGLIGGAGIASITLDAQGRVTAVGTATYVQTSRQILTTAGDLTGGGDLSADRTLSLANAGAGAATYGTGGLATITLDAKGRVTGVTTATYALASRQITGASGLTGGGDLSADRTITMPNTGPGAGTIGSHSALPISVTLDVQGRVTGVTTQSTAVTLSNDLTVRDYIGRRLVPNTGTDLVAGDFTLSAGWGATRSISNILAGSKDVRGEFTVTSAGAGQAANPTIILTFKNGAFPSSPFAIVARNGGSQPTVINTWVCLATTLTITFVGTPVAAQTYTFTYHVI